MNKWKKKNKRAVFTRCNGPQRVWLSITFGRRLPRERKSWTNFSGLERHWPSERTVTSSFQASSSLHEWRKLNFWSWKLSHLEEVSKGLVSGGHVHWAGICWLTTPSSPAHPGTICQYQAKRQRDSAHVHLRGQQGPFRRGGVWAMGHSSLAEQRLTLLGCPSWMLNVCFLSVSVKWP